MLQKDPRTTAALLDSLAGDPALSHDLLFYASFADKTFALMQREGPEANGFAKLQQSFKEAVEKVRAIVQGAKQYGFSRATEFAEITPQGFAKLLDLMHDLAIVKQNQVREKQ